MQTHKLTKEYIRSQILLIYIQYQIKFLIVKNIYTNMYETFLIYELDRTRSFKQNIFKKNLEMLLKLLARAKQVNQKMIANIRNGHCCIACTNSKYKNHIIAHIYNEIKRLSDCKVIHSVYKMIALILQMYLTTTYNNYEQ